MRTNLRNLTGRSVIGINQDRDFVNTRDGQYASAAQHQAWCHAAQAFHAYLRSLKKRFAVEVTSAARLAEAMCFPMSGSRLCPEPVRVISHAPLES